jgi:hypothetical protein
MPQEIHLDTSSTEVLLVDDEPQVRKLLANLLSRDQSYHVMTLPLVKKHWTCHGIGPTGSTF